MYDEKPKTILRKQSPTMEELMAPFYRTWPGAVPIQSSVWIVGATCVDKFGRKANGGGLVSYFDSEQSAINCANTLNTENPNFEAKVYEDKE